MLGENLKWESWKMQDSQVFNGMHNSSVLPEEHSLSASVLIHFYIKYNLRSCSESVADEGPNPIKLQCQWYARTKGAMCGECVVRCFLISATMIPPALKLSVSSKAFWSEGGDGDGTGRRRVARWEARDWQQTPLQHPNPPPRQWSPTWVSLVLHLLNGGWQC